MVKYVVSYWKERKFNKNMMKVLFGNRINRRAKRMMKTLILTPTNSYQTSDRIIKNDKLF
jgi:hypothetical protein